jgi:hypothetical protein
MYSPGPEISATDANAESARATQEGAQNRDTQDGTNISNKASLQPTGASATGIPVREGTNSNSGMKMDDGTSARDENDNKESGQRRSIISSIRLVFAQ